MSKHERSAKAGWRRYLSFPRKLNLQLAAAITAFIVLIEALLLVGSYQSEKSKLNNLHIQMENEVRQITGVDLTKVEHEILSDADVDKRLKVYTRNIVLLVLLIIVSVVVGTLVIFNMIAGRHILKLARLNQRSIGGEISYYPQNDIPGNEIGDLVRTRDDLLEALEKLQNNLAAELDAAKQELVHKTKLSKIGELSASIAHDIKNPLSIIDGYVTVLNDELNDDSPDIDTIKTGVAKIAHATDRVNKFVQAMNRTAHTGTEYKEDNCVSDLVQNSLFLVQHKLRDANVELISKVNLDVCVEKFWGDMSSLEQVMMNLCSNACDTMEGREVRQLTIDAIDLGESYEICVSDTGSGIPADKIGQIFDSFYSTKQRGKGLGLGLSICKQIVENHGGKLTLRSEPDVGTTFCFNLLKKAPKKSDNTPSVGSDDDQNTSQAA